MTGSVLVLNATYEPLNVTSVWRACSLVLSRKAEVLEAAPDRVIRSPSMTLPHPVVIRLVAYVKVPRFTARRITRRALFARDANTCQYCGSGARLTLDHVTPRSRGGTSAWENVVTACAPCNLRKGSKSLRQSGLSLRKPPRAPISEEMRNLGRKFPPNHLHESWLDYLYWDAELEA